MLISFTSLVRFEIWFQKCYQIKRGEHQVMLTHCDWHDFTVSIKMQGSNEIYIGTIYKV